MDQRFFLNNLIYQDCWQIVNKGDRKCLYKASEMDEPGFWVWISHQEEINFHHTAYNALTRGRTWLYGSSTIDGIYPNSVESRNLRTKKTARVSIFTWRQKSITVLSRLWNLLLVSCGGAPAFWKEEAASWRMGAEPGWLSDDKRTRGGSGGWDTVRKKWFRGMLPQITTWPDWMNTVIV